MNSESTVFRFHLHTSSWRNSLHNCVSWRAAITNTNSSLIAHLSLLTMPECYRVQSTAIVGVTYIHAYVHMLDTCLLLRHRAQPDNTVNACFLAWSASVWPTAWFWHFITWNCWNRRQTLVTVSVIRKQLHQSLICIYNRRNFMIVLNWESGNVSDLHSVTACFKFRLEHWINFAKIIFVFLSLTKQISVYYLTPWPFRSEFLVHFSIH
jgi:hypothetical protein